MDVDSQNGGPTWRKWHWKVEWEFSDYVFQVWWARSAFGHPYRLRECREREAEDSKSWNDVGGKPSAVTKVETNASFQSDASLWVSRCCICLVSDRSKSTSPNFCRIWRTSSVHEPGGHHMSFFWAVVCRCLSMWRSFSQRADIVVRGMTTVEQFLRLNMNELRNVHGLLNHLLAW